MPKYSQIYTYSRELRSNELMRAQIDTLQKSDVVQPFIAKMKANIARYNVKVCNVNPIIGRGLVAGRAIPKGTQLGIYYGELMTVEEVKNPQGEYLMDFPHMPGVDRLILDGEDKVKHGKLDNSNIAYVNHSCRKHNCVMVTVGSVIVLETECKIKKDQPLTANYDEAYDRDCPYWLREMFAGQAKDTETQTVMRCVCERPRCPFRCYQMIDKK